MDHALSCEPSSGPTHRPRGVVRVGPLPFSTYDPSTLLEALREALAAGTGHFAACGIHQLLRARREPGFRARMSGAQPLLPEGVSARGLVRLAVPGGFAAPLASLREAALEACVRERAPVFLLGGRPEEGVRYGRRLHAELPGLRLAGAHTPGPGARGPRAARALVSRLRESRPRLLLCAPGSGLLEELLDGLQRRLPGTVLVTLWNGLDPTRRRHGGHLRVRDLPEVLQLAAATCSGRLRRLGEVAPAGPVA